MGALSRQIPNEKPKKVKITCLHHNNLESGQWCWYILLFEYGSLSVAPMAQMKWNSQHNHISLKSSDTSVLFDPISYFHFALYSEKLMNSAMKNKFVFLTDTNLIQQLSYKLKR